MKTIYVIVALALCAPASAAPQANPPKVKITIVDKAPPRISTRIGLFQYLRWLAGL